MVPQDESVNNVADRRTEFCGALIRGPFQRLTSDDGENCKRTEKPQEDSKSQAPAHAGVIAAHVALEENSEN